MIKTFLARLLSRKFLLALGGFITAAANQEWNVGLGIILGYLGMEGAADVVERRTRSIIEAEASQDTIVAGR